MKKIKLLILIVFLSLASSGCATRAAFIYSPGEKIAEQLKPVTLPLRIAVPPFLDMRSQDNISYRPLHLIPLVPYANIHYDRPDAANRFISHAAYNFRPSEDFAKALVAEVKQNRFFEEVFFTQREVEPGADLVLTGKIKNTQYNAKTISYGLSVYAPFAWLIGLPVGTAHNSLSLVLEMTRPSDGAVVWFYELNGESGKTIGLYYNWASDFDGYPMMLREGLHKAMEELAHDLQSKDLDYGKGKRSL